MSAHNVLKNMATMMVGPMARTATRKFGRIFMYHRFGERGMHRRLAVDEFDAHVRYIASHFRPRRLADVVARLHAQQPLEDRTVVITVDDGYADFFEYAYPVLRRHGVPATVYLVSEFVEQRIWLWFDAIRALVDSAAAGRYELQVRGARFEFQLSNAAERHDAWARLAGYCLTAAPDAHGALIAGLQQSLQVQLPDVPLAAYRAMTWDEVRRMDPAIVEVGAHTLTHPILSHCDIDEQRRQIEESKRLIEHRLGRSVSAFCYPNGQAGDYTWDTTALVRNAGFSSAVLAYGGLVSGQADPYQLERVSADDRIAFRNCINGLWHVKGSGTSYVKSMMRPIGRTAG